MDLNFIKITIYDKYWNILMKLNKEYNSRTFQCSIFLWNLNKNTFLSDITMG